MWVALIGVIIVGVLANFLLEQQFRKYVRENQERLNLQMVTAINREYNPGGWWNAGAIHEIGMNALEQGLILRIDDNSHRMIWDAMTHNRGMCQQMIVHMARNMQSRYPNWKGGYTERSYDLRYDFKIIGRVRIGYYGPFFYTDNDLLFINTLNRLLVGVAILALLMALAAGALTARRISKPLSEVIQTAQVITSGDYQVQHYPQSNIREMNQLNSAMTELATALKSQETLRKQLTADVAHELRTPLATLQSHLEAMIDGIWDPDRQRLKSCHDEVNRISRMVKDLERLTKFESSRLILDVNEFDLGDLIRQLMINFQSEAVRKGIRLVYNENQIFIRADKDKMSQLLINLIANSLKYTSSGGLIELRCQESAENTTITVCDTGSGIAPKDLPFVFERFYRADKSRNRLTGGSGIGLTIVKAIVEAHEGTITVKSEVGKGTEFTITLPKK
ncbi:MAG TPA: two-component sensor histidine kinase [Firmicutes bacterium]|nr:two-component sensor histidine kinase [Bacillota bacterium]